MPWEFDGPNKNPLRDELGTNIPRLLQNQKESYDQKDVEETINYDPKLHRIVLSPLETMLAVGVLSEAVQQMNIFIAQLPPSEAKFNFMDLQKRALMKKLLVMVKDELLQDEEPAALYCYNDLTLSIKEKEDDVREHHLSTSKAIATIKVNMQQLKDVSKGSMRGMESGIATIEAGYEEACSNSTIMKEYATKYQNSRIAQNSFKIKIVEKKHKKELYNKLKAIQDEHRANKLIVNFVDQSTKKLEEELAFWSKKYDQDIEEIDLKIAKANQEIPESVHDLASLLSTYYTRELEMAEYIRMRNYRLKLEDIEVFLEFFTVIIQAWWRGTMVRWEIGPYAPRKPKKKQVSN